MHVGKWTARQGLVAVALLLAVGLASSGRTAHADEEGALRDQALKLNDITGADPISGTVQALVDDAAGTKKLLAVAVVLAKKKDQPFNVNAACILARVARRMKDIETCEVFYRVYAGEALKLSSGYKLADAYGGLIDMLYENKKFVESEKICQEFLALKGDDSVRRLKPVVLRRMIQALAKQGKSDEANKLVDNLIKAQPGNWLTLELKGWVQREAGNSEDAAKTYEDVLDRINKDKELKNEEKTEFLNEMRYILSGVYVDTKQIDKAGEHLKALLAQEPDNPTYNNDLGYIWADHDMNLDEAETLIRKAIEQDRKQRKEAKPDEDKDNAAYLDSLGWVLFKKKQFKEAKPYLLQAAQDKDGQHIEIYDHLADVHMALGEKAEAIAAWKKGLELTSPGKREEQRKAEVEKKLKAVE